MTGRMPAEAVSSALKSIAYPTLLRREGENQSSAQLKIRYDLAATSS